MKIVVVVSRNLMDLSKGRAAARLTDNDIVTCSSHSRIISMMSAGAGDRRFKLIFDQNLYSDSDLKLAISQIEDTALKYKIRGTEFLAFAHHEKIDTLKATIPEVEFVPRSKFFYEVVKYL